MAVSVDVIICTRNRAESLRETLDSIARLEIPDGVSAHLLIVDNASTDHTRQVVESCSVRQMPVRYFVETQRGLSNCRNRAIAVTDGQILLFTDDDVRPPVDWIAAMIRPIVDGQADAVAGAVRAAPNLNRDWVKSMHRSWLACTEDANPNETPFLVGANMCFSRKVLSKVPGFDPELGAGARGNAEDTLFTIQLERAGFHRVFLPNVVVEHHFEESRLTRDAFVRQAKLRGELDAYLKHHWFHSDSRFPRLRLAQRQLQYLWKCLTHLATHLSSISSKTIADWELPMLEAIYLYRFYLSERKLPRRYEKMGLIKISS